MYDQESFESDSAATAQRYQDALDLLYHVGCQYSIKTADVRLLCDHMGVQWDDLKNHSIGKPAPVTLAN
jgi:hypothetical protein